MAGGARISRYAAFGLNVIFAVVGGAFVAGEVMTDPGGVAGVLLSVCLVVSMVGLAGWALRRPNTASRVLTLLAVVVASFVVLDVVIGIVPHDDTGPVGAVAGFVVAVGLGFLGLRRPVAAGRLLLLIGAASLAGVAARVLQAGEAAPVGAAVGGSSGAVAVPVLLIGALFVVAGSPQTAPDRRGPDDRRSTHPTARPPSK